MSKMLRWRISKIRGPRFERVGVVEAKDANAAIKVAIRQFKITDPFGQNAPRGEAH